MHCQTILHGRLSYTLTKKQTCLYQGVPFFVQNSVFRAYHNEKTAISLLRYPGFPHFFASYTVIPGSTGDLISRKRENTAVFWSLQAKLEGI